MKEYAKKSGNLSRTIQNSSKAYRQAPISEILKTCKNRRFGNPIQLQDSEDEESSEDQEQGSPKKTFTSDILQISADDYNVEKIFESGSTKPILVKFTKDIIRDEKVIIEEGERKVIKFGNNPDHLSREILANKLYQVMGIPVLNVILVKVDEKLAQLADYVEKVQTPSEEELVASEDFFRHVGADMLFANWDLFKLDNWMKIGGRMVRSDNGGALDKRAQGGEKDKKDWPGDNFGQIKTMNKGPYRNLSDKEIADSIRTMAFNLTREKIEEAFRMACQSPKDHEKLIEELNLRIERGLEWANKVYPLEKEVEVRALSEEEFKSNSECLETLDPIYVLKDYYKYEIPDTVMFVELFGLYIKEHIGPPIEGDNVFNPDKDFDDLFSKRPTGKTNDPLETIPMVGPEELGRKDQFGKGLAKQMPLFFERMKTGRLIRRMSTAEKQIFEQAAQETDIIKIVEMIFPTSGDKKRGEIVWSVNGPYIFDRERRLSGDSKPQSSVDDKFKPEDYEWIMEIYITDEMLKFLQDYAYINNPVREKDLDEKKFPINGKPSAFMGNPTLKMEGVAGGNADSKGIPNVVLKRDGFAKFWSSMRKFHFIKADQHFWKFRSLDKDTQKKKRIKRQKEEGNEIRKSRDEKKHIEVDFVGFDDLFAIPIIEKSELEKEPKFDVYKEEKVGIENLGNTCYLAAGLNMLAFNYADYFKEENTPSDDLPDVKYLWTCIKTVVDKVLQGQLVPKDDMEAIISQMAKMTIKSGNLDEIKTKATELKNVQQDVSEIIFGFLFDLLPLNWVQHQFTIRESKHQKEGVQSSLVDLPDNKTLEDYSSLPLEREENQLTLNLPIPDSSGSVSFADLIEKYKKPDDSTNYKYVVDDHLEETEVIPTSQFLMSHLPLTFTVVLKRFASDGDGTLSKIDIPVDMPLQFGYGGFIYNLNTVIFHHGGYEGGHYTMSHRSLSGDNKWIHHDDSMVGEHTNFMDVKDYGYIYTYKKGGNLLPEHNLIEL